MMDMNGDGYPDIIAGGTIQYTNSMGGLSGEKYSGIGTTSSDNESQSWGYGGQPVASVSNIVNFAKGGSNGNGNLIASYITDASGNKFTETVNEYDAYSVTANADNYSFVKKDVIYSDRASAFVSLRYTANKQYEGASQGMVISEAWNEYYLNGNHGELKSYRYSDKGSLGNNGAGGYDYTTNIQYTSNSGKHIFGLPTNVTVVGGDGSMFHNVSATYDTTYPTHLTQVSQQLGSGVAVTDYKYDRYGNITQKTLPANMTSSIPVMTLKLLPSLTASADPYR